MPLRQDLQIVTYNNQTSQHGGPIHMILNSQSSMANKQAKRTANNISLAGN